MIDQEWVKELATYISFICNTLTCKDKRIIMELFLDYKNDGFNQLSAMKKAILIFDSIKSWKNWLVDEYCHNKRRVNYFKLYFLDLFFIKKYFLI